MAFEIQLTTLWVVAAGTAFALCALAFLWNSARSRVREAEASNAELSAIIETAPDATLLVNDAGEIEMLNAQAEALFGYDRAQLLGGSVEQLVPMPQRDGHARRREGFYAQRAPRSMGVGLDLNALRADGTVVPVDVNLSVARLGKKVVTVAAVRDISWHRQVEAELREAKLLAERAVDVRTRFLAAASHDLRQPLQSLSMYHAVLARTPPGERDDVIKRMAGALDSMGEMLDALLDVSKFDSDAVQAEFAVVALQPLFERLIAQVSPVAESKGLAVRAEGEGYLIRTDPALLYRVLENFVVNAIRYTDQGSITLRSRLLDDGEQVSIDVIDTGIGMPRESLDDIFDEYTQLHNDERDRSRGLGLGLAVVKRIASLLEHQVLVRSEVGMGSEFSVLVPFRGHDLSFRDCSEESLPIQSVADCRVLLVDDDGDVLLSTQILLESAGFEVIASNSAARGIDVLAAGFVPDVILTDYRLPAQVTGLQFIRKARERMRQMVPALVLTGDTSISKNVDLDANVQIIFKPFDGDALLELVSQAAKSSGHEKEA